jgi:hypothetical protein
MYCTGPLKDGWVYSRIVAKLLTIDWVRRPSNLSETGWNGAVSGRVVDRLLKAFWHNSGEVVSRIWLRHT